MSDDRDLRRAAKLFQAMADPERLALLLRMAESEASVSDLAAFSGAAIGTVSARLKVLTGAELVVRRREGQTIIHSLADHHVRELVENALAHATGRECGPASHVPGHHTQSGKDEMADHQHHHDHPHVHGPDCGHTAIKHNGHVDYVHDGHLHHQDGDTVEEHVIPVTDKNPAECTAENPPKHEAGHVHGPGCGHEAVPHGDHIDYIVDGRLHHPHGDHCDDHGPVEIVQEAAA
ncbi:ArsR/SmtB family transcription factor [Fulvimarina endophytica]|nr:metalloregulator ArsR/SmtB family transcription factor [Fulvimarina endophytica]